MKIETDRVIEAKTVKVKRCFDCWFNHYLTTVISYDDPDQDKYVCKATMLTQNCPTVIEPRFLTQDSEIPPWCPLLITPLIIQIENPPPEKKNMELWDYLTEESNPKKA
jgi:hypothetical protein